MVLDKIKAIAAAKARVAQLEKAIARELHDELGRLPVKFGFSTVDAFVAALTDASGRVVRRGRPAKAAATKRRRKRAVITDAVRSEVKKLVEAGKTGAHIAASLKISLPTVQNIKKALGLVGKKAAPKAKAKAKAKPRPAAKKKKPAKKPAAPEKAPVPAPAAEAATPAG
jgi:hypothetical protein